MKTLTSLHSSRTLVLVVGAVALVTTGCPEDTNVVFPENSTVNRARFVSAHFDQPKADAKVAQMRGLSGAPTLPVAGFSGGELLSKNFGSVAPSMTRIPLGYGCEALLQSVFPDAALDADNDANYDYEPLKAIIDSVRRGGSTPLYTLAFDIGKDACTVDGGAAKGKGVSDPDKWAKVATHVLYYFNSILPDHTNKTSPAECQDKDNEGKPKSPSWYCYPSIFRIEYGRDPFGAWQFTKDAAGRQKWFDAYKLLTQKVRATYPYAAPGSGVGNIEFVAPSVPIKASDGFPLFVKSYLDSPSGKSPTPLMEFIDWLAKEQAADPNAVPIDFLSFEITATKPDEAKQIAEAVALYAHTRGVKSPDGKPVRLMVVGLEIEGLADADGDGVPDIGDACPDLNGNDKVSGCNVLTLDAKAKEAFDLKIKDARDRRAAYDAAFFTATKILWQDAVSEAIVGRTAPIAKANGSDKNDVIESNLFWFDVYHIPGQARPTAWHYTPFYLMRDQQIVASKPGLLSPAEDKTKPGDALKGPLILATVEQCKKDDGSPSECDGSQLIFKGRQRRARTLVTEFSLDAQVAHDLSVFGYGLPGNVPNVAFQCATIDQSTRDAFQYTDFGQLPTWIDNGAAAFAFTRTVAVPSIQYCEFYY